ncbi:hypothetical protein N9L68_06515 [bacterium]|nr:hypothetical protein [bacterium]
MSTDSLGSARTTCYPMGSAKAPSNANRSSNAAFKAFGVFATRSPYTGASKIIVQTLQPPGRQGSWPYARGDPTPDQPN